MMPWILIVLRTLRALSYLIFSPAPDAKSGRLSKTEIKLVGKGTAKAGVSAATITLLLLLVAHMSGVEMDEETATKLAIDIPILYAFLYGVVSAAIRLIHDSGDKPIPTPPPEPHFPPDGILKKADPRASVPNPPPPPPKQHPWNGHFFG